MLKILFILITSLFLLTNSLAQEIQDIDTIDQSLEDQVDGSDFFEDTDDLVNQESEFADDNNSSVKEIATEKIQDIEVSDELKNKEINESEFFDEEKITQVQERTKKALDKDEELEEFQREIASEKYKKNMETPGVLKPSRNVKNGNKDNKVIVEPRNIIPVSSNSSKMEMVPYRTRRRDWGQIWGLSYGLFQPNDYILDQSGLFYSEVDSKSIGLISLELTLKYNFSIFSAGLFSSIGYFKSELTDADADISSELTFIPLKVGVFLELDTLFSEPYIVPYGHAGVFASQYKETSEFTSVDGTSFLAIYLSAGLMFQVDWLDDYSSRQAYLESGVENTFLFAEVNYMSSSLTDLDESSAKDPDLSSLYYSAGLKVEF